MSLGDYCDGYLRYFELLLSGSYIFQKVSFLSFSLFPKFFFFFFFFFFFVIYIYSYLM